MAIYVSNNVVSLEDEYVEFLLKDCHYDISEAEIRRWEIEYQFNRKCSHVLMKPGSSGYNRFQECITTARN